MNKEAIILEIGNLIDAPVECIGNEVNEDLIFSDEAFSTLGSDVPEETILECLRIGQIPIGSAAITTAGDLESEAIVHFATCGFDGRSDEKSIVESLRDGLNKVKERGLTSIALPEIGHQTSSTPLKRLAELLLSECLRHNERDITLEVVRFRLRDQKSLDIFNECLRQI